MVIGSSGGKEYVNELRRIYNVFSFCIAPGVGVERVFPYRNRNSMAKSV